MPETREMPPLDRIPDRRDRLAALGYFDADADAGRRRHGLSSRTDVREADEDNPRGYLEFEPVKNLLKDSKWLFEARGKAVKIVAPLLAALPPDLACRVILCERDLDEVLDSQERMLQRRNQPPGRDAGDGGRC